MQFTTLKGKLLINFQCCKNKWNFYKVKSGHDLCLSLLFCLFLPQVSHASRQTQFNIHPRYTAISKFLAVPVICHTDVLHRKIVLHFFWWRNKKLLAQVVWKPEQLSYPVRYYCVSEASEGSQTQSTHMFNFTWCVEAKIRGQLLPSLWHVLFFNHIERCLSVSACTVVASASEPYICFLASQCL